MKHIIFALLLSSLLLFSGCKKTENLTLEDVLSETEYTQDTSDPHLEEARKQYLLPKEGDSQDILWGKFLHALYYDYPDVIAECLDAYVNSGEDYDMLAAACTLRFLREYDTHGYKTGAVICFFEDFKEHPTLQAGDIIVEINGIPVDHEDSIAEIKEASGSTAWKFTILRPFLGEPFYFEKQTVTVHDTNPLVGHRSIVPIPLDESNE